uniref:Uncharacterized protein n=1 Tax=viral metagenome TaxID=1070528 RepID=A0A6M3JRE4_9ZZZZ
MRRAKSGNEMDEDDKSITVRRSKQITIDFEEYFQECEERTKLRRFHKLVMDNRFKTLTKKEIEEYNEAAGL